MESTPRRVLQCEEWEKIRIGSGVDALTISDVTELLDSWRHHTGTDAASYFIFSDATLTPKNWSGTLAAESVQLEVTPMGYSTLGESDRRILDQNLSHMLERSIAGMDFELGEAQLTDVGNRPNALIDAFCQRLKHARRSRVIRRYTVRRGVTRALRGRTVFPDQAINGIRLPGTFVSEWVSLDEDTPENRFLKYVLAQCQGRAGGYARSKLESLLAELGDVTLREDPWSEWACIRFDRLSVEYRETLSLGKAILDGEVPGLFAGAMTGESQVVFTARLFEHFIGSELSEIARSNGYHAMLQAGGNYLGKWKTGKNAGKSVFEMRYDVRLIPDYPPREPCLVDTKWKRLNPGAPQLGIAIEDMYQLFTYAVSSGHGHVVLLYPWIGPAEDEREPIEQTLAVPVGSDYIWVHLLTVPVVDSGFQFLPSRLRRIFYLIES